MPNYENEKKLMSEMDRIIDGEAGRMVADADNLLEHNRRIDNGKGRPMSQQRYEATQRAMRIKTTLRGGSGAGRGDNPHG
jgi:predicted neutral ceramidase superfamily lipid hydrolase